MFYIGTLVKRRIYSICPGFSADPGFGWLSGLPAGQARSAVCPATDPHSSEWLRCCGCVVYIRIEVIATTPRECIIPGNEFRIIRLGGVLLYSALL